MKSKIYNIKGEEAGEIALPEIFSTQVREDIVQKYFEAEKRNNVRPYAPYKEAGKRHSASGTISHQRHDWKGHYGRGMSRIPRKTMWRRGTQFFWVGAEISSARGGRRAHPPRLNRSSRKINKKEILLAISSALASTAQEKYIKERYSTLDRLHVALPIIIESKIDKIKTKEFFNALKLILKENFELALKKKSIRAGKGKSRGRKYKSNAGILLVKSNSENIKMKGIDVKSRNELAISDLYPLGRLTIYTQKALEELGGRK